MGTRKLRGGLPNLKGRLMSTSSHQPADDTIDFTIMYSTHDAFRRDLARLIAAAQAGTARTPAIQAGWENFKNQLLVHHTVEDEELWPRVERAVADRPQDLAVMQEMENEHALLDPLLKAVDQAMAQESSDLADLTQQLADGLGHHMKHEEASALPLIQEVLTPKDWSAFRAAMARRQGPKGAAMYVPWILDGASSSERERFLGAMPAPVRIINRMFWESRYQRRKLWAA
jgi:iron-sulfur cluster repair protein YtfE (RIC family)